MINTEFLILIFYSFFILVLNIFDYKSWKYSYIGDEWAFFEYAKDILNRKVPLDIFSENGVYGYHPVLSSIWQAFIMFITDKGLFGWKLSSALIVPLSIIPFYIWNKIVFNRTVAIISTVVFSLANAMMAFSHIGYNNIQIIFFYIVTLYLLEIALKKKSLFYFILTSIVMGLGFYTFYASRIMILIVIIYILFHPERKKFKLSDFIVPFILYFFIISPIIFHVDFLYNILRQTSIAGSEIQKPEERPIYFILNFIHSFFAFLTKSKNSHYMVDGLIDIFSAIGVLFGFIWLLVAFRSDWRAKFLLISYILLILIIGALHQYHYPVNTRLIFLIPLLATISGVGFSRMSLLVTYYKRAKQFYTITIIIICFIIFLMNYYIFYIKMPQKLRFTMQAYVIKFLQKYEKFEKIMVISFDMTYLNEIIKIYNLDKRIIVCNLDQFESMLKENKVNNKVVLFDYVIADKENKIMRLVKPENVFIDNESGKILFYIYDFINAPDYYKGFFEFWTTGKTSYEIKSTLHEIKQNMIQIKDDKDITIDIIKYKINNKIKKFKLKVYKNFKFEKSYKAMRNSEIKNCKISKLFLNDVPTKPSDIAFDNNLKILFLSDSNKREILKYIMIGEDKFNMDFKIDIPGKLPDKEKEIYDNLFLTLNSYNKILYVLDSYYGRIIEVNYDGALLKELVNSDYLKNSSDINYSENKNYLIVNNPEKNTIMIFDMSGNLIDAYSTTRGIGEGQMNSPVSAEFIRGDYLLVADSLNGRVQLFDKNMIYIKNYRIGVCSKIQWPDILYFDYSEKPYFVVTQPVLKKIFIYFINEDVF
ncbi:MAG: glycosyltransferase family 39 protein, partial [Candidatus Goldbacteria bacterium]|nr:glycosyltransferase family 39 protein [Candidatus Goldiibacteriota bacterium]